MIWVSRRNMWGHLQGGFGPGVSHCVWGTPLWPHDINPAGDRWSLCVVSVVSMVRAEAAGGCQYGPLSCPFSVNWPLRLGPFHLLWPTCHRRHARLGKCENPQRLHVILWSLNLIWQYSELRRYKVYKVEVAVLGSPSLVSPCGLCARQATMKLLSCQSSGAV